MSRIVRAAECRRTAWRNGGGETVEIAVHPPGATLDTFDWRISRASVVADGPFSVFPGIDRTLVVLAGAAVTLAVAGRPPVHLDPRSAPFSFPGDVAVTAKVLEGPITDLNVMTRRGRFSHHVERLHLDGPCEVAAGQGPCVVFCCTGRVAWGDSVLDPGDALVLSAPCSLAPQDDPATVLVIRIRSA